MRGRLVAEEDGAERIEGTESSADRGGAEGEEVGALSCCC